MLDKTSFPLEVGLIEFLHNKKSFPLEVGLIDFLYNTKSPFHLGIGLSCTWLYKNEILELNYKICRDIICYNYYINSQLLYNA